MSPGNYLGPYIIMSQPKSPDNYQPGTENTERACLGQPRCARDFHNFGIAFGKGLGFRL